MSNLQEDFISYGRQVISEADIAAVVEVLRSPFLTQGPTVPAFEQAVATKVDALHGVAVNSATSALHIACLALGVGPGDRLWTSPITFVASANCGRFCGASVDFVDIEAATGLMSMVALEAKLEQSERDGTLPKVVVPVHLAGNSCDMLAIGSLAKRYGFAVIEDASHAIGGHYRGEPIGNCRHSSITVFSFHPVKIITTGEGGMATTNDTVLARCMRELRSHGIVRDPKHFMLKPAGPWAYEQQHLGFNYRMSDIQAALGMSQLNRLDEFVAERNRVLRDYREMLDCEDLSFLETPNHISSSVHLAVVKLKNKTTEKHRSVFRELREAGIGVQLHYSPIHLHPYYQSLGFKQGDYAEAEKYSTSAISLPVYPGFSGRDQHRVVRSLQGALK